MTAEKGWDEPGIDLRPATDARTPQNQLAEARFVSSRLRELADGGVPRGEMVVLLRAFTHLDAYEDSLDRAGLRPYVVGGRGYWSQQQVGDVCALLGAIANPLDDMSLFGALASPAGGVSPDALWLLRAAAGRRRQVWPAIEHLVGSREVELGDPEILDRIDGADRELLGAFAANLARAPLTGAGAAAGGADRRRRHLDRIRPRGPDAAIGRGPFRQRPQADAARRRVRGGRGPRPARLP